MGTDTRERWLLERFEQELAAVPLPPRERWRHPPARPRAPTMVVTLAIAFSLVVGLGTGAGLASLRQILTTGSSASSGERGLPALLLPSDWNVFASAGLLIAAPREWTAPEVLKEQEGPGQPTWIALRQPSQAIALTITLWREPMDAVVSRRFIQGNLQPLSRRDVAGTRRMVELLIGDIRWRDPAANTQGTYEARHLLVPLGPDLTAAAAVTAAWVPSQAARVSDVQRLTQDLVASSMTAIRDTNRHFQRADVERVLRAAIGKLEATSDPGLGLRGQTSAFAWDQGQSTVFVVVHPSVEQRIEDERRASETVRPDESWRGIGNVLVVVRAKDANARYAALAALDGLLP